METIVINGRKLNVLERKLFHMNTNLVNTILIGTPMAFILSLLILIYKTPGIDNSIKLALALALLFLSLFIAIQISKNIFPDLGLKREEAEEAIKRMSVFNKEKLTDYILITRNPSILKNSSGDPVFDALRRRVSKKDPATLKTLERPSILDLLTLIKHRDELETPLEMETCMTLKELDEDDRILLYKAINGIESSDPFAIKAIRSLGMDRIDEGIEEVLRFKEEK